MGLIKTDFDIQAKVCFEITLACAPTSTMLLYNHLFKAKHSNLNCPFYQLHLHKYHDKY